MAEVEQCKQADIDLRGHDDFLSESGGMMDFEEDRIRPKRYYIIGHLVLFHQLFIILLFWLA
jgi:hypothetical protein